MRAVANDNARFNATAFRASNGFTEYGLLVRGDSTQSPTCPQGDGWSSVDLLDKSKQVVHKLKCSTVSPNIGCMFEEDFKAHQQYVFTEGKCNMEIPETLKKIEN